MEIFFDDNNIFHCNLNGGRKKHSTISAITNIYNILYKNKEQNYFSAILATDLSAAFDTVDNEILLNKMKHYGIEGGWNDLFRSFLTDRRQFVKLETKNSIMRNSVNCGTIQGSKLSGFLFNIYGNEIPLLHKLINTEIYYKMGAKTINIKNTNHGTITFVDDSSNIIGFKDHSKLNKYLENYFI